MHVMHMVGRALGIREELNMCTGDLAEVRKIAREILVTDIQVSLTRYSLSLKLLFNLILQPVFLADSAPSVSRELDTDLLEGVKILNPFINPEGFR